ncbi:MAG TPA: response regulator, partial [Bryobacteraceae bacterium]|nr:response regulator [Bryobacteraceae bacterium]
LDISRTSAERLLGAIDDFRDLFSTPSALSDAVEEFDLGLCLAETVELLNLACQNPATRVVFEAPMEPLPMRQHRQSVEHLFMRILDSVLKLTAAGEIHVSARALLGDDVSHRGCFFTITPPEPELVAQLERWMNADVERLNFRDLPEMPVSLAILVAGKGVALLGGSAEMAREPGVPTHLALFLPTLAQDQGWALPEPGTNSLNVLLTEDCDESYALSELMLRKENVWRARDGHEAMEMVKKRRFDIVVMDIHMDGMDGYTAIQAIRDWETQTANARTPIVILSSDDIETQRRSAARCGCTGFLRKPLRSNDLTDVLDRLKSTQSLAS